MKIELIYDSDCPNVEMARENLRFALNVVGLPAQGKGIIAKGLSSLAGLVGIDLFAPRGVAGLPLDWQEWDRDDPASPAYAKTYGSPTILVNGEDVSGLAEGPGTRNCRVYKDGRGGLQGVPQTDIIISILQKYNL